MMEITLRLSDGQKKIFSEQELVAIVEEHLQNSRPEKETTELPSIYVSNQKILRDGICYEGKKIKRTYRG